MSQVGHVVRNGSLDEHRFLEAHRLARLVFEPEIPETDFDRMPAKDQHLAIDTWRQKLGLSGANILYVEDTNVQNEPKGHPVPSESYHGQDPELDIVDGTSTKMLGLFFCYPRSRDGIESYHIWIAAVDRTARGQGIFPILMDTTEHYARTLGYQFLTIATIPAKFERMFSILSRPNSEWEIVKWETLNDSEGRKVVMKRMIV